MNWLDKLEKKYRHLAINNLMLFIIAGNFLFYFLINFSGNIAIYNKLTLVPSLVLEGQIWRLITFVFIPPNVSPVFLAFTLYFYYLVGNGLEQEWGGFKFNFYYFIGIATTIIASFLTGASATAFYLNLSLFFAFARIYPDFQIMLFLIIPLKIRYLALFNWVLFIATILFYPFTFKVMAIVALINYFIFFGRDIIQHSKNKSQVIRNRRKFGYNITENRSYIHKCAICGITDIEKPEMDFRYCVECNGHYGYCEEHIRNHKHLK